MTPGKLTVQADGRVTGHAVITHNQPFPCVNGRLGVTGAIQGVIPHTMVGNLEGTIASFNDPARQASAHFGVGQDGRIHQFGPIGKGWEAWHAMAANLTWYGIESADNGDPRNPYTDAQIAALAQLVELLSRFAGFPLQVTDDVHGRGVGTHVMGGAAWGGHTCVPVDSTEVLTPGGWVLLRDITAGDEVASWAPDSGMITFATPLGIIKPYLADTIVLEARGSRGLEMTADHTVYWRPQWDSQYKTSRADEVPFNARIPLAGHLADVAGLPVSDDHLRLLVHVQADGHYMMESTTGRPYGLEFHYALPRKITHMTELLHRLEIGYRRTDQANGTVKIRIYGGAFLETMIKPWLPAKVFTWAWLGMSEAQFSIFAEELMLADGCVSQQVYRSAVEQNLDIVQALCHLHGRRANRDGHGSGLILTKSAAQRGRDAHMCYSRRSPAAGRRGIAVGCLTTADGTLLIRQDKRVAILGNCPGPGPRAGQRRKIIDLAKLIRAGQPEQPPSPPMAPRYVTVTSDGQMTLAGLAAERGVTPMRVLHRTCEHFGGFPAEVAAWGNAVLRGDVDPAAPMPGGMHLRVPVIP